MNKCQKCGQENVPLLKCFVESEKVDVCFKCFSSIEDQRFAQEKHSCLKRKQALR